MYRSVKARVKYSNRIMELNINSCQQWKCCLIFKTENEVTINCYFNLCFYVLFILRRKDFPSVGHRHVQDRVLTFLDY